MKWLSYSKKKGFEQHKCFHSYASRGFFKWSDVLDPHEYAAPTHQMAMKWLREICKLSIEPYVIATEENCIGYAYAICSCKTSLEIFAERWDGKNPFISYEEAVEAALKYSLKNLI